MVRRLPRLTAEHGVGFVIEQHYSQWILIPNFPVSDIRDESEWGRGDGGGGRGRGLCEEGLIQG